MQRVVALQVLARRMVDARRVDADEQHALVGESLRSSWAYRAEVGVPHAVVVRVAGAEQDALATIEHRVRECRHGDLARRAFAANVDDATAAEVGAQVDGRHVVAVAVEVQRRVGVRADVHRHAHRADVARRAVLDTRDPFARERRVPGELRRRLFDGLADVPDAQRAVVLRTAHPGLRSCFAKRSQLPSSRIERTRAMHERTSSSVL